MGPLAAYSWLVQSPFGVPAAFGGVNANRCDCGTAAHHDAGGRASLDSEVQKSVVLEDENTVLTGFARATILGTQRCLCPVRLNRQRHTTVLTMHRIRVVAL